MITESAVVVEVVVVVVVVGINDVELLLFTVTTVDVD